MIKRLSALLLAATMIFSALPLEAAMFSEPNAFGVPTPESILGIDAFGGEEVLPLAAACDHSQTYNAGYTAEYHVLRCNSCGEYIREPHSFGDYGYCEVCYYNQNDYSASVSFSVDIPVYALYGYSDYYMMLEYSAAREDEYLYDFSWAGAYLVVGSYTISLPSVYFNPGNTAKVRINLGDSVGWYNGTSLTIPYGTNALTMRFDIRVSDLREVNSSEDKVLAAFEQLKNSIKLTAYNESDDSEISGSTVYGSNCSMTYSDAALRCSVHRFSNRVCTVCGYAVPSFSNINLLDLMGLSETEMVNKINSWFGGACNINKNTGSTGTNAVSYYITLRNPEDPIDSINFSVGISNDIVFGVNMSYGFWGNTSVPSDFWSGIQLCDGIPVNVTCARLEALAASGKLTRNVYNITQAGLPKGAKQIGYGLQKQLNNTDYVTATWNIINYIYNSNGYELIPDEDLANRAPTNATATYYPYSKLPDFSNSKLNVLGLSEEEAVSAVLSAFPGASIVNGSSAYGSRMLMVNIYNIPLLYIYIVNGRAEYMTVPPTSVVNIGANSPIRSKLPNLIEGFNSKVTRAELQAMKDSDPSAYFFSTKADSLVAGGIQEIYAFTKGDVIMVYGYVNYTYSLENGKVTYRIDNNTVPFINEVRLVPNDYSNVYIADLIDTPANKIASVMNSMFNMDPIVVSYNSSSRYPYSANIAARDFTVSAAYADKVESISFNNGTALASTGYVSYPSGASIPNVYKKLPKITKDLPYILDSAQLKSDLSSSGYKYTVSEVSYVDYMASLGQNTVGSESVKDINKLKMNIYTVDIGNANVKFAYPNGYIAYDVDYSDGNVATPTNPHVVLYDSGVAVSVSCVIETKEPTALIPYAVTGGYIYIDPVTGEIVKADASVTEVVVPKEVDGVAVTGIGENAFSDTLLKSIEIPTSVTSIADSAFSNCPYLELIKYQGTEEMWDKLVGDDLDISDTVVVECRKFDLGDLNGDGRVDVQDGVLMQRILANLESNQDYKDRADLNGDGRVDVQDGVKMQRILANLE